MFNWKPIAVRSDNIVTDITMPIDLILDTQLVERIYEAWDMKKYGDPLDFGGGVKAITSGMLLDAGEDFLVGLQGIGKKKAGMILEKVEEAHQRNLPYK